MYFSTQMPPDGGDEIATQVFSRNKRFTPELSVKKFSTNKMKNK